MKTQAKALTSSSKNCQRSSVEQILNDIQTGRITRSKTRLANFCENYSFISSIEPMKVEEALEDPEDKRYA